MSDEKKVTNDSVSVPYVGKVKVGNYRVWRSRASVSIGDGEKDKIECVNVSDAAGAWSIRIPATSGMYGIIIEAFNTADDNLRDQFLGYIFGNMLNITTSGSVPLHDGLNLLTEVLSYPYFLLSESEMKDRIKRTYKKRNLDKRACKEHVRIATEHYREFYDLVNKKIDNLISDYETALAERYAREQENEEWMEHAATAADMAAMVDKAESAASE